MEYVACLLSLPFVVDSITEEEVSKIQQVIVIYMVLFKFRGCNSKRRQTKYFSHITNFLCVYYMRQKTGLVIVNVKKLTKKKSCEELNLLSFKYFHPCSETNENYELILT
jgi:hypothetical protein